LFIAVLIKKNRLRSLADKASMRHKTAYYTDKQQFAKIPMRHFFFCKRHFFISKRHFLNRSVIKKKYPKANKKEK
jgi:hypothetical protein